MLAVSCSKSVSVGNKVAVVIPDAAILDRWAQDKDNLKSIMGKYGVDAVFFTSPETVGGAAQQVYQLQDIIRSGYKYVVLTAIDYKKINESGVLAENPDVKVICHDRLVVDNPYIDYISSANTVEVGRMQAMFLLNHFHSSGAASMTIELLEGPSTDLNASDYRSAEGTRVYIPADKIALQGKLHMMNGKVLVNFYPIPVSGFHLTVGAFFGKSEVIDVYNRESGALIYITEANQEIERANAILSTQGYEEQDYLGVTLGDYLLVPNESGDVKATFKTKGTRLYVGLGTGRAVPKRRVGVKFDIGCMLWGKPEITCNDIVLHDGDWDGKGAKVLRIMSKMSVYPCLNLRLCGRIF